MKLKTIHNYLNKVLVFFIPGKAGYWNSITPCSIDCNPVELGKYYLDFRTKINYPGPFTDSGIPIFSYMGRDFIEHPTVISQYAFAIYEELRDRDFADDKLYKQFLKLADWFVDNAAIVKGGKGWFINIEYYSEYNLDNRWLSAMAQGQAISVLARAAHLTDNPLYKTTAIEALGPFNYKVNEGGLVNYFNGCPVYEECPTPNKTMAVLNGWIFSLFGLYDLILLNDNHEAKKLFDTGISSLKKILVFYDLNNWTQYFLFNYPKTYYASYTYHILATEQLKALFYLTGDIFFFDMYTKWSNYSRSLINRTRAMIKKIVISNKFLKV